MAISFSLFLSQWKAQYMANISLGLVFLTFDAQSAILHLRRARVTFSRRGRWRRWREWRRDATLISLECGGAQRQSFASSQGRYSNVACNAVVAKATGNRRNSIIVFPDSRAGHTNACVHRMRGTKGEGWSATWDVDRAPTKRDRETGWKGDDREGNFVPTSNESNTRWHEPNQGREFCSDGTWRSVACYFSKTIRATCSDEQWRDISISARSSQNRAVPQTSVLEARLYQVFIHLQKLRWKKKNRIKRENYSSGN